MKLLGHVHGKESYMETVGLLRSKGIPIFSKYSGSPWIGPYRATIYVVLDSQFQDARAVLADPSHEVAEPVDVLEYEKWESAQETSPSILKWAILSLVAVATLLGAVIYFSGLTWSSAPNNSFKPTAGI